MLDLAERCEKATGPDRELDCDIGVAVGAVQLAEGYEPRQVFGRTFSTFTGPRYTASLDAAMTLAVQGISAPDVLRHAIKRCSLYGVGTFIEALPRFVASEWLRARAAESDQ